MTFDITHHLLHPDQAERVGEAVAAVSSWALLEKPGLKYSMEVALQDAARYLLEDRRTALDVCDVRKVCAGAFERGPTVSDTVRRAGYLAEWLLRLDYLTELELRAVLVALRGRRQ